MVEISINDITPPLVLLRMVDTQSVDYLGLVESIREHGLFKPILVREYRGKYQLLDGLHRFTAVCELKWETVPCRVIVATDDEAIAISIQANAVSKDTLPCEYAKHLRRYLQYHPELTMAGLSQAIKKTARWISDCLLLTQLDEPHQVMVNRGEIPLQSAYLLARLPRQQRPRYVDLARSLPVKEFRDIAAESIRRWKEQVTLGRQQTYFPDLFKPRGFMRSMREVRFEEETAESGVEITQRLNCQNALDGWRAAIKWLLHLDPDGIAEQKRLHELRQRGELL